MALCALSARFFAHYPQSPKCFYTHCIAYICFQRLKCSGNHELRCVLPNSWKNSTLSAAQQPLVPMYAQFSCFLSCCQPLVQHYDVVGCAERDAVPVPGSVSNLQLGILAPGGSKTFVLRSRPGNRRFWDSKRPSSSSKRANLMVSRCILLASCLAARGVHFTIEQPTSSLMQYVCKFMLASWFVNILGPMSGDLGTCGLKDLGNPLMVRASHAWLPTVICQVSRPVSAAS